MSRNMAWSSITESLSDLTTGFRKPAKINNYMLQVGSLEGGIMGIRVFPNLHVCGPIFVSWHFWTELPHQQCEFKLIPPLSSKCMVRPYVLRGMDRWSTSPLWHCRLQHVVMVGARSSPQGQACLGLDGNKICNLGVKILQMLKVCFEKDMWRRKCYVKLLYWKGEKFFQVYFLIYTAFLHRRCSFFFLPGRCKLPPRMMCSEILPRVKKSNTFYLCSDSVYSKW